jgi:DNA-binding MarR family transcriptional regulator
VFLVAVPIAAASFGLTWLLKEIPLRRTTRATDPAETYAPSSVPATSSSLDEIRRALSVLVRRENRSEVYERLAERVGLDIGPDATWLLLRLGDHPDWDVGVAAATLHVPDASLRVMLARLEERGLVLPDHDRVGAAGPDGRDEHRIVVTDEGRSTVTRLLEARRQSLAGLLEGWSPDEHAELAEFLHRFASALADGEPMPKAGSARGAPGPPG